MPPAPPRLSPEETLAREWLPLRSLLLDVAASMDRLDRAGAVRAGSPEQRTLAEALRQLQAAGDADRAERIQRLYSRGYDPDWRERFAAGETAADGPEPLGLKTGAEG